MSEAATTRYEEAPQEANDIMQQVREKYFPEIAPAKIKIIFDTKKRSKGKRGLIFASICMPHELIAYLASDDFDYIIIFDKVVWNVCNEEDRIRIMRHELRHAFIDDNGAFCTIKHDFEDFHREVELNSDDPMWGQNVAKAANESYAFRKARKARRVKVNDNQ